MFDYIVTMRSMHDSGLNGMTRSQWRLTASGPEEAHRIAREQADRHFVCTDLNHTIRDLKIDYEGPTPRPRVSLRKHPPEVRALLEVLSDHDFNRTLASIARY